MDLFTYYYFFLLLQTLEKYDTHQYIRKFRENFVAVSFN